MCIFHIHIHTRLTFGILLGINIYIYTWELEKQVHNSARFNFTKNYLKITFCKAIISKVDQKLDWHVYVYFIYIYIPV